MQQPHPPFSISLIALLSSARFFVPLLKRTPVEYHIIWMYVLKECVNRSIDDFFGRKKFDKGGGP
jgi:hypothetical protein